MINMFLMANRFLSYSHSSFLLLFLLLEFGRRECEHFFANGILNCEHTEPGKGATILIDRTTSTWYACSCEKKPYIHACVVEMDEMYAKACVFEKSAVGGEELSKELCQKLASGSAAYEKNWKSCFNMTTEITKEDIVNNRIDLFFPLSGLGLKSNSLYLKEADYAMKSVDKGRLELKECVTDDENNMCITVKLAKKYLKFVGEPQPPEPAEVCKSVKKVVTSPGKANKMIKQAQWDCNYAAVKKESPDTAEIIDPLDYVTAEEDWEMVKNMTLPEEYCDCGGKRTVDSCMSKRMKERREEIEIMIESRTNICYYKTSTFMHTDKYIVDCKGPKPVNISYCRTNVKANKCMSVRKILKLLKKRKVEPELNDHICNTFSRAIENGLFKGVDIRRIEFDCESDRSYLDAE